MPFPQWGDVPSWLAAGSLLLAFRVFFWDRVNTERRQVDMVGWWTTISPVTGRHEGSAITMVLHIRNASELPVDIASMDLRPEASWKVTYPVKVTNPGERYTITAASWEMRRGSQDYSVRDARILPMETWESAEIVMDVRNQKPSNAIELDIGRTRCVITLCCITDNAGRRWRVSPGKGGRAKRYRWYSSTKGVPREWRGPIRRNVHYLRLKHRISRHRVSKIDLTVSPTLDIGPKRESKE